MRSSLLKVGVFLASVALVVGCGKKETAIPTNLDQPLPKVAAPVGGGGGGETPGAKTGADNKAAQPVGQAD